MVVFKDEQAVQYRVDSETTEVEQQHNQHRGKAHSQVNQGILCQERREVPYIVFVVEHMGVGLVQRDDGRLSPSNTVI